MTDRIDPLHRSSGTRSAIRAPVSVTVDDLNLLHAGDMSPAEQMAFADKIEAIAALQVGDERDELAKWHDMKADSRRILHKEHPHAGYLEEAKRHEQTAALLRAPVAVTVDELAELKEALDSRCLYCNPQILRAIADEIDCDGQCEFIWREWDTNAGGCHKSERGDYCPNDLAETLRAVARVAEKFATSSAALAAEIG